MSFSSTGQFLSEYMNHLCACTAQTTTLLVHRTTHRCRLAVKYMKNSMFSLTDLCFPRHDPIWYVNKVSCALLAILPFQCTPKTWTNLCTGWVWSKRSMGNRHRTRNYLALSSPCSPYFTVHQQTKSLFEVFIGIHICSLFIYPIYRHTKWSMEATISAFAVLLNLIWSPLIKP